MSQERTRFPIQPGDRRRTARSSEDVRAVPDEPVEKDAAPPDRPPVPPHRRHEGAEDRPGGGDADDTES